MPILYTNVLDQMSEIEYISKSVFYVVNCQFRRQNECLSLHGILRSSKPGTIAELLTSNALDFKSEKNIF